MASTVNTYGTVSANAISLKDTVKFVGATDDTKTISLKLPSDPTAAGDVVYTLPVITSAQTLLHNGSSIAATQVNINGATAETSAADTDEFLIYDASATSNKKMTLANLKTYAGGVPSGTSAQAIVYNGSNVATAVTVSGDITINNTGVTAIGSNKVTNAMLQNNSVDANKLANNAVDSAAIANNAVTAGKYGAGSIVNADVNNSAAIAGSKIDPDFGSQTVETTGDFQTAANKALYFGSATANGSWRVSIQGGGGAILFEKRESGAWVSKGSFSS